MSDTPRTDNGYRAHYAEHDHNRELCAGLERELAAAQAKIAERLREIDRLDCTVREGGQTLHCPVDNQCLRCRFNSALKRERDLEKLLLQIISYAEKACGYSNNAEIGKEYKTSSDLLISKLSAKLAELEAQNDLYRRAIEVLKNG